jgi:hypothetical protein
MKLSESKEIVFELVAGSIYKQEVKNPKNIYNIVASVDSLKDILKDYTEENSKAFSYFVGELSNGGMANKNGHACTVEDTVKIYKKFEKTFIDLDHKRSNIVGFIVKANLTDPETKEILSEEQALENQKPVNISIGFIVWPHADTSFYSILDKVSNPEDAAYGLISLSWEASFDEYNILKGSPNQFQGEVVFEDSEIEKLTPFLKDFGGSGLLEDGVTPVYLLATGENLTPLGAGLVVNPAAHVEPVISIKASEETQEDLIDPLLEVKEKNALLELQVKELSDKIQELELKDSQFKINNVTKNSMKIKNVSDITDENLKEIQANDVVSFISDEIAKKSEEHKLVVEEKEKEISNIKATAESAEAKVTELSDSISALTKELEDLKAAALEDKVNNDFQFRMNSLSEEFVLEDADTEVIAPQIRGLSDEDFAAWKKGFDVIAKEKSKKVVDEKEKAKMEKEEKEKGGKEMKASTEEKEIVKDPLEELKAKAETIPNSSSFSEDVLASFKDAFSLDKGVTVTL